MSSSFFYIHLDDLKRKIRRLKNTPYEWEDVVKNILLFIRDINEALEELYTFAHLPDVGLKAIDRNKFKVSENNYFYDILYDLAIEFEQMQELVPLSSVNFKDTVVNHVLHKESKKTGVINYQKTISLAWQVYEEILTQGEAMGIEITSLVKKKETIEDDSPLKKLLWDEV